MAAAFNDMTVSLSHWHEKARQHAEQLQASFQRFRAVTLSVHDPIVSTDGNGAIIFWHPRAEALFGYSEEQAIGRMFSSLLAPASQDRYATAVQDLSRDGRRCAGGERRSRARASATTGPVPAGTVARLVEVRRPDVPDRGHQ